MRGIWPLGVVAVLTVGSFLRLVAFLGTAPLATLPNLAELGAHQSRPTLLHIFQAEDCPRFRELVRQWNELHRRHRLPVLGVGLDLPTDSAARATVVRASGASFPVRDDPNGEAERLLLRLGYRHTPLAVLLDGRGRPRLVLPPLPGPDGPRRAARAVLAAEGTLAGGGRLASLTTGAEEP